MNEYISYAEKLEDSRWKQKRAEILRRDNYKCKLCGVAENLNVHHRYYIYGANPWEYRDNALVSLCHSCHKLVHETLAPIVYLYKKGNLIRMNFTPCSRCGGYGYFSEYKHVENGVCFRCRGQRYEEMISSSINIDSFIDNHAQVFDSLEVGIYAEDLFKKGKEIHDDNIEMAKKYYYQAAILNNPQAQNNLGWIFKEEGKIDSAKRLFLYSAMQGIGQGKSNLGFIFRDIGDVESLRKWVDILKEENYFKNRWAAENFFNFIREDINENDKPSIEILQASMKTLIYLASN